MKKVIFVSMLSALGGLGFTVSASAQDVTCGDVVWSATALENTPNIAEHCLDVVDKNGTQAAMMRTGPGLPPSAAIRTAASRRRSAAET